MIGPTVLVLALLVLATVYAGAFDVDQWAPPTLFILVLLLTLVLRGGAARLPDRWVGLALGGAWGLAGWAAISAAWAGSSGAALEGAGREVMYAAILTLPFVAVGGRSALVGAAGAAAARGVPAVGAGVEGAAGVAAARGVPAVGAGVEGAAGVAAARGVPAVGAGVEGASGIATERGVPVVGAGTDGDVGHREPVADEGVRALRVAGRGVVCGIALIALYTMGWMLVDGPAVFLAGRLNEPIGYRNATALLFCIAYWPLIVLAATRERGRGLRAVSLGLAVLMLGLAFLTQSRGVLLGLGCGGVVALALGPDRVRRVWLALLSIALARRRIALAAEALSRLRRRPRSRTPKRHRGCGARAGGADGDQHARSASCLAVFDCRPASGQPGDEPGGASGFAAGLYAVVLIVLVAAFWWWCTATRWARCR